MPQFRITQKYANDCRITELLEPLPVAHPLDDWFIDVIRFNRKKIAIATHAQSLFTFFIDRDLAEWAQQAKTLFSQPAVFCKTMDRKISGHMNDFKRCAVISSDYSLDVHLVNWNSVSETISIIPVNLSAAGGCTYPLEMLGKRIGYSFKKTDMKF